MADNINDYFLREGTRISTNINQKVMEQMTPWISLYGQESWEEGRGASQNTYQFDRAILNAGAAEVGWESVGRNGTGNGRDDAGVDGGSCIPPSDNVTFSQTQRSYNLQQKAIWGPALCVNDLRDTFIREAQMGASVEALADQSREIWINRKRSEYKRIADNLVVADSSFALGGNKFDSMVFPAYSGTDGSILTAGFLDYCYEFLNHQGGQKRSLGMSDGRPIYGLVTSPRQSRRLMKADGDTREDFRFSDQNSKLLGPMGVKNSFGGFTHLIDEKTERFNNFRTGTEGYAGTATIAVASTVSTLTLSAAPSSVVTVGTVIANASTGANYVVKSVTSTVAFVVTDTAGAFVAAIAGAFNVNGWIPVPQYKYSGGKTTPNPDWLSAGWEDSYIFHQGVCTSLVPKPLTSVGKAKFDAVNYTGEYKWTNYLHATDNPDGTIGRFRGVLMNGTRPDNPEFGIVIRHRACPSATTDIITCNTLLG
jgi:hypothetical protein